MEQVPKNASIALEDVLITPDVLKKAIRCKIDKAGMEDEAALEMAWHILGFFGNNEYMLDNILDIEDRDVFYILEDAGLLGTEREETLLYDSKNWRIHYWVLNKKQIFNYAMAEKEPEKSKNVYESLPDNIWEQAPA